MQPLSHTMVVCRMTSENSTVVFHLAYRLICLEYLTWPGYSTWLQPNHTEKGLHLKIVTFDWNKLCKMRCVRRAITNSGKTTLTITIQIWWWLNYYKIAFEQIKMFLNFEGQYLEFPICQKTGTLCHLHSQWSLSGGNRLYLLCLTGLLSSLSLLGTAMQRSHHLFLG